MDKVSRSCLKRIAQRQWKYRLPVWLAGTVFSAMLVCASLCWAAYEKGWHITLILCCACIALFLIGRKAACPDKVSLEILEAVGATREQIEKIIFYQMAWMFAAAVPVGIAACIWIKTLVP